MNSNKFEAGDVRGKFFWLRGTDYYLLFEVVWSYPIISHHLIRCRDSNDVDSAAFMLVTEWFMADQDQFFDTEAEALLMATDDGLLYRIVEGGLTEVWMIEAKLTGQE
jgi:hypothetical protein